MSEHVPRKKYEELKQKAQKWQEEYYSIKEKSDDLQSQLETLENQLNKLDENDNQYENETIALKKEVVSMKKDRKILCEKYQDKISQLERDIMLKDNKIQLLEDTKKDIYERYLELKEDNKEMSRYVRNITMPKKD